MLPSEGSGGFGSVGFTSEAGPAEALQAVSRVKTDLVNEIKNVNKRRNQDSCGASITWVTGNRGPADVCVCAKNRTRISGRAASALNC